MFAINIFLIILGVGLLIFVHELGHFMVAKLAKIKVEIFSLGFGPAFFKFRKGETEYRLCLIPLGGYVKMAGESVISGEATGASYEFVAKPPFTRIGVFAAGAIMNLLLAFPLCILMYLIGVNFSEPLIGFVQPGSAENEAGILPGDVIKTVDNVPVSSMEEYKFEILRKSIGETCQVKIQRGSQELTIPVIARGSKGLGLDVRRNIIAGIVKNSPAEQAGLKLKDEIVEIDGEPVISGNELKKIRNYPGRPINFKVRHSDNLVPNSRSGTVETYE
ncbi:MAG: RIP metalloprotease RseP, partial [Planctomycetota bacterium]